MPNGKSIFFYPFGTYDQSYVLSDKFDTIRPPNVVVKIERGIHCYFFDQEPFYNFTENIFNESRLVPNYVVGPNRIVILATSEKSDQLHQFAKQNDLYKWYYFFHGFAALDWYRDFQYVISDRFDHFDKVFICYNHLTSNLRSYRLHLVANLKEQDLLQYGFVSLFLQEDWQKDLYLDPRAIEKINRVIPNLNTPLVIDTAEPKGSLSASVNLDQLTSAFWHIVTETVYFLPKLHLTEKIFKPIVAKRPFILAAAPGNLAYLKSYGFKTFDRWIDESYDQEQDHYLRIELITAEIKKLCNLSSVDLKKMHQEMQEILEYNHQHFYTTFKNKIVDELVDNFEHIFCQINNGRQPGNHSRYHTRYELPLGLADQVKKRLKN